MVGGRWLLVETLVGGRRSAVGGRRSGRGTGGGAVVGGLINLRVVVGGLDQLLFIPPQLAQVSVVEAKPGLVALAGRLVQRIVLVRDALG